MHVRTDALLQYSMHCYNNTVQLRRNVMEIGSGDEQPGELTRCRGRAVRRAPPASGRRQLV